MTIGIAFIRGINVGGRNLLPMAALREMCGPLGLLAARTHIQSGNLAFRAQARALARAEVGLAATIERERGFRPQVVVRTLEELRAAVDANPFASRRGLDKRKVLVMFLESEPAAAASKALAAIKSGPDEARLVGRDVYLSMPNGVSESKLPMASIEKTAGVPGTCRNLNTIEKMIAIAEELAEAEER